MHTGKILKGNHPHRGKTGQGRAVKLISINGKYFGLTQNGLTYHLDNPAKFLEEPTFGNKDAQEKFERESQKIKEHSEKHPSFGLNFGDIVKEEYVFVGYNQDRKESKFFKIEDNDGNGNAIDYKRFDDTALIKYLAEAKALTVYYTNKNGEKVKKDVDSISEIKDLEKIIFQIQN